jgi:fumarate reductase (CoM/CoB) subunit A
MDTMVAGGHVNNQKLARTLANESGQRVLELERYGNIVARDEKGNVQPSRGSGHSVSRYVTPVLLFTLREEMKRLKVQIVDETIITKLVTSEDAVVGATGLEVVSGDFILFKAKSTILATGGAGQLFGWGTVAARTTNPVGVCGGGYSLAYDAGAELVDMEFVQFIFGMLYPPQLRGTIATVADHREYLLDKDKQAFAENVPIAKWNRARAIKEVIDIVAKGKGSPHGGVWLDAPRAFEDWKAEGYVWHFLRMQVNVDTLLPFGYDPTSKMLEIYPTLHHIMGGVAIDEECKATVLGLFACGEAAGGVHGANRLGSNAYASTQVFGKRAGEYAAKRAKEMDSLPGTNHKQVELEKERISSLISKEGEMSPPKIRQELQDLMWSKLGPIKKGSDIGEVIEEIQKLNEEVLPKIHISSKSKVFNRELLEALELYQLMEVAEIIARASHFRTESRGSYQREDYPEKDDEQWLVNNFVKKEDGAMRVFSRPIVTTTLSPEQIKEG